MSSPDLDYVKEAGRGRQISWDWSYRLLEATLRVLGIESEWIAGQPMLLTYEAFSCPCWSW